MQFPHFLLHQQYITQNEFFRLYWRSIKGQYGRKNEQGFLEPAITSEVILDGMRPIPFGDVLKHSDYAEIRANIFARSGATSIEELVRKWYQFHVDHLEPISDYSLTSDFGERLYFNHTAKAACGRFVADSERFGVKNLVHDEDHVIIPEGTSAFYVGLAICAVRKRMIFITSNGALIRELHENPLLSASASGITVIGGEVDGDVSNGHPASRGFIGKDTEDSFNRAIDFKPGATVVVCSVSGLLPNSGPYAPPCPKAGATRYALLRKAAESNVRQIIFVADHSKMRDSLRGKYGDPIFSDANAWRKFVSDNRSRVSFVVAPPEELLRDTDLLQQKPSARSAFGLNSATATPAVKEYLAAARDLDLLSDGGTLESRFFEAKTTGANVFA